MNFDEDIDRFGTHSVKWDMMEKMFGVPAEDGLAMWVADMDFRPPAVVTDRLRQVLDHGLFGYYGDDTAYKEAIRWWLTTRHGWTPDPEWIFSTHGLVNGGGLCIDAFTQPGDGIILFTPMYHAFLRIIPPSGREIVQLPLKLEDRRYALDTARWDGMLKGHERMILLSAPHNPGGRVWTAEEMQEIADFAKRHDLIVVSDEIHCDLTMPGVTHNPMIKAEGVADRLVMMTATTKTFNIAGAHTGNVIIPDPALRKRFNDRMMALGISPNLFGLHMAEAAYSPEGAAWVDALMEYVAGNARVFDEGVNAIPGVTSIPLEGTYLSWVDFTGTGMAQKEIEERVEQRARIAVNRGPEFGDGGEGFLRFNIATPRARVEEAVRRLQEAFGDLQ